jgi:hypothetical protein
MTLFDQEAIEAAAMAICMQDGHWPEQDLGMGKLRWTLYKKHAEVALAAAEASLRARGMLIEGKHTSFGEGGAGSTMVGSCEFWRGDFNFAIIRIAREEKA